MTASVLPVADLFGSTTRKFDASREGTGPAAGPGPVVEAPLDRGGRLGVVGEHGVLPRLRPPLGSESLLELRQELGVGRLAAPAGAEDRPDEGRDRNDVVDRGGRQVDPAR